MKIINPEVKLLLCEDPIKLLKKIERCGRLCYKSEGRITSDSYVKFLKGVIARGHLSVIEHGVVTALVTCDRGVSHEIVRHRIGSYSQESQRYVKYITGIEVIKPNLGGNSLANVKWESAIQFAEDRYKELLDMGLPAEIARSILPNATKTEIAITYNFREWRHFIKLRGSKGAHPQIREIVMLLLKELQKNIPVIFDDFTVKDGLIERII